MSSGEVVGLRLELCSRFGEVVLLLLPLPLPRALRWCEGLSELMANAVGYSAGGSFVSAVSAVESKKGWSAAVRELSADYINSR